jgi:DNA-binding protein HU-beta
MCVLSLPFLGCRAWLGVEFTKGKQVNKSQLIEALAGRFGGNKRAAAHALAAVVDTITHEVARGEKVAITGFGAFEKQVREARIVRNPKTGERKRAKKTAVPKFRAGADLKAVVSGAKKPPKLTLTTAPGTAGASASKNTAAKKSTKKSAARKSAARKAPPTKTARRSTASKSVARKSTAKNTASRGTTRRG